MPDILARRFVAEAQDAGPLPVAALARAAGHLDGVPEDVFATIAHGRAALISGSHMAHSASAKPSVPAFPVMP